MKYRLQKLIKAFSVVALTGASVTIDAQTLNWSQAGPVYTAGRARNIVMDKADPSGKTLYTGSASSGVFKTVDGGANWAPINDQGEVRNISYMAQDANNVIWVATGEGFLRYGQKLKAQVGTGLYQLIGTALTLKADANMVGTVINRIACSPNNANIIALATNKGVMVSTDGGIMFSVPAGLPNNPNVQFGLDVKFDGNGILWCSVGNERGNHIPFTAVKSKVFKSTDASLTSFTDKTPLNILALGDDNYGRIELAIAPSDNNVIYASIANKNNSTPVINSSNSANMKAVFVSYDGGANWGMVLQGSAAIDPLSGFGSIATGDYAHCIIVNPVNPNQIFLGGYSFYIFTRTGGTDLNPIGAWGQLGSPFTPNFPYYLHENIHDIKIIGNSAATAKFYFVTDAGIYRSVDMLSPFPSFQPFYSGLVTGQFNSVSFEAKPLSPNSGTATAGQSIVSNDGFIGGTGGNGLTYFSGKYPNVSQETNYVNGDVFNAEFSKLLPYAAFFTTGGNGSIFRTTDVRNSQPGLLSVNAYTGALSRIAPDPGPFAPGAAYINVSGSPFKLWENYGQVKKTPDSLVFYNDSLRVFTSVANYTALLTQTNFTFSAGRPNRFALIDSIAIRTSTAQMPLAPEFIPVAFTGTDKKDIFIKLNSNYTVNPNGLTSPPVSTTVGPVSAASVTLDPTTLLDEISVTFTSPPFANKTQTFSNIADPAVYYRLFATIFYKYKAGDSITIVDNSISTRTTRTSFTLAVPLRWSANSLNGSKPYSGETNPPQKVPAPISARLAFAYNNKGITDDKNAIVVSKAPLNLNDPLNLVRVSQSGALTMDANGVSTQSTITITGKPTLLEWSKGGSELYYATDDNKLYRVSNIFTIMDYSQASYSGKLSTDIFKYGTATTPVTTVTNPASPYRTTLIGVFTKTITSISISKNDSNMVLTFNDPQGASVMYSGGDIRKKDHTNINFASKDGTTFPSLNTYCSLIEKDDMRKVFVGTDNGIYYTADITANPTNWVSVNSLAADGNKLPNVQVFDIKQQTMAPWECYNSGMIYVATSGRGVWKNDSYFLPNIVSVNELQQIKKENNLSLYPNPTNGKVTASFSVNDGEEVSLQVFDINGRLIKTDNLGKLYSGQTVHSFETIELTSGMYIVNISGTSGIKRVAKLVVTK